MSVIKTLPTHIINKIAAGEVVERPASVIKELVENSLDAGATLIEVEIENGGKDYIRITDNGHGMSREDAQMSIKQHATSKIGDIDDLFKLETFGFRGEALASISSVSRFELRTKRAEDQVGTLVMVKSNEVSIEDIACPIGTTIEVKSLFETVPARRSYLKGTSTEYNHIVQTIHQFALIHLHAGFKFTHNGKQVFSIPANQSPVERIQHVLYKSIDEDVIALKHEGENVRIAGFVSKPYKTKANRSNQYIFVNGRYVKSPLISKAVQNAYNSLIPHGRHAMYILHIQVNPEIVDVNVHPRKLEVRFVQTDTIFRAVLHAVMDTIKQYNINRPIEAPENTQSQPFESEGRASFSSPSGYTGGAPSNYRSSGGQAGYALKNFSGSVRTKESYNFNTNRTLGEGDSRESLSFTESLIKPEEQTFSIQSSVDLGDWVLLGQVQKSYILVEDAQRGLLIIDQHAADERINYEELKAAYEQEKQVMQNLLIPITLELSPEEFAIVMENIERFTKVGFEIEQFGDHAIIINAIPVIIKQRDPVHIVREVLDAIITNHEVDSPTIDYMLKTISCKSAIKFGDVLHKDEQIKMLQDLQQIDNQMACAHGRPIILELPWDYLNNKFERP